MKPGYQEPAKPDDSDGPAKRQARHDEHISEGKHKNTPLLLTG